ncbi:MAG: ACT domain-containing protein [Oscillochloris sp.]|nr:ACT domain-containing protein [Oscillochloris sp.]
MEGERDLSRLLANLQACLRAQPYVFVALPPSEAAHLEPVAWAIVREDEAVTLIVPHAVALQAGLPTEPQWACITLHVHSSLAAVGMIAAVATALAAEGISSNPVAGYYHDHLFVQWERRHDALHVLQRFAAP